MSTQANSKRENRMSKHFNQHISLSIRTYNIENNRTKKKKRKKEKYDVISILVYTINN